MNKKHMYFGGQFMGNKTRLVFKILGFVFLAGGLGVIGLGLYYLIPEFETFIYIASGIGALYASIMFLFLAFNKSGGGEIIRKERAFKKQDPDDSRDSSDDHLKPLMSTSASAKRIAPKEKARENRGTVVCYKCGTENPYGEYYCSGCKSAIKKICKLCGHDNPPGTTVCEGCEKSMD